MPTNEPLSWTTIFLVLGIGALVLMFSLAGVEPQPSTAYGSTVLLNRTNTEVSVTGNGNCYNYTLPANTYSTILFDARGVVSNVALSDANLTVFVGQTNIGSVNAGNKVGITTFSIPLSVQTSASQQASVLVQINATNTTGSPVLLCKSFYAWGVV